MDPAQPPAIDLEPGAGVAWPRLEVPVSHGRSLLAFVLTMAVASVAAAGAQAVAERRTLPTAITFDSSKPVSGARIALADVSADFPRDWTGYEALVLEVRASSPQRVNVRVFTRGSTVSGERSSRVLFHPYPGVWLRAAIPVSVLAQPPATGHDMAAVGNRSRVGYFLGLWGPFVPLRDVEAIGFDMEDPIGSPDAGGPRDSPRARPLLATPCWTACRSWTRSASTSTARGRARPARSRN